MSHIKNFAQGMQGLPISFRGVLLVSLLFS